MSSPRTWAILTPEFPPHAGGIGDFVALVGARLAAEGDRVLVHTRKPAAPAPVPGVEVHVLPDDFGAESRRTLARAWDALDERAVLFVQYVPQGFGWKGMNLPFARFLGTRSQRLWLMLHEIAYPFIPGQSLKHEALALTTRLMLRAATARAERAFVSTPAWEPLFERYAARPRHCEWLPIPATITAREPNTASEPALRPTIAHFGTYGAIVAEPLARIVVPLLAAQPALELVLVGRGSHEFAAALGAREPALAARVRATGAADEARVASELSRAWVTIFPFLEGVTTRRTSLMSALAAGAVIVTTSASCTESVWRRSGGVELVDGCDVPAVVEAVARLLADAPRRAELRARARTLYRERFHLDHAVQTLRERY